MPILKTFFIIATAQNIQRFFLLIIIIIHQNHRMTSMDKSSEYNRISLQHVPHIQDNKREKQNQNYYFQY